MLYDLVKEQRKKDEKVSGKRVCTTDSNQVYPEYKSLLKYSYHTEKGTFSSAPGLIDSLSPSFPRSEMLATYTRCASVLAGVEEGKDLGGWADL